MADTRQVTALAHAAAEAIRDLNHLTRHPGSLAQPGFAYELTGALFLAASRPPQLITQISGWTMPWPAAGSATTSARTRAGSRRRRHLPRRCPLSAAALAGDLDVAQQQLALINGQPSLQ